MTAPTPQTQDHHVRFESLGLYLPERTVTTQELVDRLQAPPVFALEQVTGLTPSLLTLVAVAVCIPVGLGLVKINNRPLPLV